MGVQAAINYFSSLPDCVLVVVFSWLTFRERVRIGQLVRHFPESCNAHCMLCMGLTTRPLVTTCMDVSTGVPPLVACAARPQPVVARGLLLRESPTRHLGNWMSRLPQHGCSTACKIWPNFPVPT